MNFFGGLANSEQGADLSRFHVSADRGYNGTIADLGSSIDPRTPEKEGTPGRTRLTDITGYMGRQDIAQNYPFPPTSLGIGGSGPVDPMSGTQEPAWRTWPGSVPASSQQDGQSSGEQQFAPAGSGTE